MPRARKHSCPLYMPGVWVKRVGGSREVDLLALDPDDVARLRERTRAQLEMEAEKCAPPCHDGGRMLARPLRLVALLCVAIAACTGTRGAEPHDMGVAQHEREAEAHARSAEAHEDQFDPDAGSRGCCRAAGRRAERRVICWTSVRNPTAVHLAAAEAHRQHAAAHRAASAAVHEAETRACAGVDPDDRDMSPFVHAEDIVSVRALRTVRQIPGRGFRGSRAVGAVVTFRAVEGMTVASLQRVIDCHLARNASLGHFVLELPNCPLVPRGVRARVSSTDDGFAVAIRSRNARVAREILSRARRLVPPAGNDTAPERESNS